LIALDPDHAPEAEHEVALVEDHLRSELEPEEIVLGEALRLTIGAAVLTETVADWVALPPRPLQVKV
jgi:hypothetical protein